MDNFLKEIMKPDSAVSKVGDTIFGIWNAFTKNWNYSERMNALEDTKATMDMQSAANKDLATFTQGLQKDMIDFTSPKMQMERYKEAGLNPALIYGMSGGAGQTTGSASAGGVNPHSSDASSRSMAKANAMSFALQLAKLQSEIDVNKSIAKKNIAEATTTDSVRDILKENMFQQGQELWLKNVTSKFEMLFDVNKPDSSMSEWNNWFGEIWIKEDSTTKTKIAQSILKTAEEIKSIPKIANAAEITAEANKLQAEFNTGKDINWKNVGDIVVKLLPMLLRK